ncbi:hypothetical protein B0H17DRAFT_1217441 [Mycena rosella]|uniref:Peptidase S53 activation domain-containing protein n=1 Tax=Mycena rosella TaxID=1033263 RepID=A0AAD7BY28_MYCRO|nr:hypothetical protein B0H17DRAFT_1217441 [Mycena rosella]
MYAPTFISVVKSYVQPSPVTVAAFTSFASAHELKFTAASQHGNWVFVTLPVSQANTLFAAHFERFSNPTMTAALTPTLFVSPPEELLGHMEVLHPTTAFDQRSMRADRRPCSSARLLQSGRELANASVPADAVWHPDDPATETSSTLSVTGYTEQWAQRADLVGRAVTFIIFYRYQYFAFTLDGGTDPQQGLLDLDVIEMNIDIRISQSPGTGLATGVSITFLSVGDDETGEAFFTQLLDTTTSLAGVTNPPSTTTTLYGGNEVDFGSSLATKICNGYMALGARGISVLLASGDVHALSHPPARRFSNFFSAPSYQSLSSHFPDLALSAQIDVPIALPIRAISGSVDIRVPTLVLFGDGACQSGRSTLTMVCRMSAAAAVLYNPGAAPPGDMVRTQLACLDVRTRVWIDGDLSFSSIPLDPYFYARARFA